MDFDHQEFGEGVVWEAYVIDTAKRLGLGWQAGSVKRPELGVTWFFEIHLVEMHTSYSYAYDVRRIYNMITSYFVRLFQHLNKGAAGNRFESFRAE